MKLYCHENPVPTAMIDRWNDPRQSKSISTLSFPHDLPSTIIRPSNLCLRRGSKACGFRTSGSSRGAGGCSSPCRIRPRGWPLLRALFCPVPFFPFLFFFDRNQASDLPPNSRGMMWGAFRVPATPGPSPCRCPSVNQTARAVVEGGEALTVDRHSRPRTSNQFLLSYRVDRRHGER